jgi:hypothetical protein
MSSGSGNNGTYASSRDARVEILWIGVGAVGTAAFMLVREVPISADMVNNRFRLGAESSNL